MTAVVRACLVALLALVAALLPVPGAVASGAGTGSIWVQVKSQSATPLPAGTWVDLVKVNAPQWTSDPQDVAVDGTYTFTGLEPGTYRLQAENNAVGGAWWPRAATYETASDIVVVAGSTTEVTMALGPTGNVAGTVLGPDGGPVSGIAVVAYSTTDDGFPSRSSRGAQTDAFGRYDIANIAPGTYKVEFLDPSGRLAGEFWNDTLTYQTATVVNVEASQVTTLGPTTLALPVSISQPGPVLPGAGTGTAAVITVAQRPRIVGRTRVGRTLRVRPGTWSPAAVNLTYQWFARGVAIERATTSTLRLTRALRGKRIQVQVTASRIGSMPVMAASPRTARIKPRR